MSNARSALKLSRLPVDATTPRLYSVTIDPLKLFAGHIGPAFLMDGKTAVKDKNPAARLLLDDHLSKQSLQELSALIVKDNQPTELEIITNSEPRRCFIARAMPIEDGTGDTLVLWTAVETSIKDHLITALKDSRALFRDLAEAAGDFCVEVDAHGRIGYVSPIGALGYEPWALNDQPITTWGPAAAAMVSEIRFGPVDLWLMDRLGDSRCISVVSAPIVRDELWLGSRIIARDVTIERHAAAALEHAKRREGLQLSVLAAAREQFDGRVMIGEALSYIKDHFTADGCELTGQSDPIMVGSKQVGAYPLSALCRTHGEDIGLIRLWRSDTDWTNDDAQLLDCVADTVALVAAQARHLISLNQMSHTDLLTGLANRRAFNTEIQRHIARLARHGGKATLLVIDIDHFKTLNDTLGHQAGDEALVAVGKLLRDTVRDTDMAARIGGDEFAVWLDNTTLTGAERVAAALQRGIQKIRDTLGTAGVPLSFSIGMAKWEKSVDDLQLMMHRADEALYDAKRSGRACMKIFTALISA